MNRRLMKAGEKNYLKESNGTKANCNANVTQVWKSRIYNICGKISAQVFEISSQWFPKGQPEKVFCLIIGYDETLIKGNLFKMHLWMARVSPI